MRAETNDTRTTKSPASWLQKPRDTRPSGSSIRLSQESRGNEFTPGWGRPYTGRGLRRGMLFAGRYEIIEEIGKGGMGAVYKAFDVEIGEIVALKLILPELTHNGESLARFRNEIKLARRISHPRICQVYDLGEEGPAVYFTMEFVAGEDLKTFIRKSGRLDVSKAVDLAVQIAEGLAEAHRLGIVHRDLKSSNVMIDARGNAKIIDFGTAWSAEGEKPAEAGAIIGTTEYMAPEQLEAKPVDHRADIYSLGIILYEMVAGQVPFKAPTPLGTAIKQTSELPVDPRLINSRVSSRLSRIILRCLQKSAERRFACLEDLLTALLGLSDKAAAAKDDRSPTTSFAPRTSAVIALKKIVPFIAGTVLFLAATMAGDSIHAPAKDALGGKAGLRAEIASAGDAHLCPRFHPLDNEAELRD